METILGIHVAKVSKVLSSTKSLSLDAAIVRDTEELNLNAAQIFTYGPRFMIKNKYDEKALFEATRNIDLSVHSAYTSVSVWKITPGNLETKMSQKVLQNINSQLESCARIGAWCLVLHITKQPPEQISYIMNILKKFCRHHKVMIALEMVANKADDMKTYETPEKINRLTNMIGANKRWWCWCVDTAHLWGAGVDISRRDTMEEWFSRIEHPKKIQMIHLNGSSAALGSGKDKHEIPFDIHDVMWKGIQPNESGLYAAVDFAKKNGIVIICEINRGSESDARASFEIIKSI